MKKLALLLVLIPMLAACDTTAKQELVELASADSLRQDSLLNVKNQILDDMLVSTRFINDINSSVRVLISVAIDARSCAVNAPSPA